MKLVGWTGTPKFSADAFAAVHEWSGGVPRKINALMTRVLLAGALDEADPIDGELVRSVIGDLAEDQSPDPSVVSGSTPRVASSHDPVTLDLAARVAILEAQAEEQGAALRRVLSLLVEWVEAEENKAATADVRRAPAA
jgi:general secretion pathway protein A